MRRECLRTRRRWVSSAPWTFPARRPGTRPERRRPPTRGCARPRARAWRNPTHRSRHRARRTENCRQRRPARRRKTARPRPGSRRRS
ncbi:MAG: hypothetical protein F4178_04855 [Rhodospirillaceae bacterium]|nr:hypothetical protein [Rhodospirillaceae bacterium]